MEWAEDLKFTLKKSPARKGRRAGETTSSSQQHSPGESLDIDLDLSLESPDSNNTAPPKRRISGGWADSGTKSGRGRNRNFIEEYINSVIDHYFVLRNILLSERFNTSTKSNDNSPDDDIPIIPDLDDIQDELLMSEIVEPPSVSVNRVVTLKELNSDLLKQNIFSALEDVDLSILTKYLQPQSALEEADESWEWDQLFTEVTAEIHSEKTALKTDGEEVLTHYLS